MKKNLMNGKITKINKLHEHQLRDLMFPQDLQALFFHLIF